MDEKNDISKFLEDPVRFKAAMDSMDVFLNDVAGDNDRYAGITLATVVDDYLSLAIETRLVPMSSTMRSRLYKETGALRSFSAKIDLGFALGLYGHRGHSDLHKIRRVRNRFAHHFSISKFDHEKIAPICRDLKTPNYSY